MSKSSIITRITITMSIVIAVTTTAMVGVQIYQTSNRLMTDVDNRLQSNVQISEIILTQMLDSAWTLLDTMANLPQVRSAVRGDGTQSAESALAALYNYNISLGYFNLYDQFLIFDSNFDLLIANDSSFPQTNARLILAGTHFSENIRQAEMRNSWASSADNSPLNNRMQIWISQPIFDDYGSTVIGMAAIPINAEGLTHFLSSGSTSQYHTGDYFTLIADSTGRVIFSHRPGYLHGNITELGFANNLFQIPRNQPFEYVSAITRDNELAFASVEPTMGWHIISGINRAYATNFFETIFFTTLPITIVMLLSASINIFLMKLALKPLKGLTQVAQQVAAGNMNVNVDIERHDEVGQVMNSFLGIVRSLNILRDDFMVAEQKINAGYLRYKIENNGLGGAFAEILEGANNIIFEITGALDELTESVIMVDNSRNTIYTNKTLRNHVRIFDGSESGMHVDQLLNADLSTHPEFIKAFNHGLKTHFEMQFQLNHKQRFDMDTSLVPVRDKNNNIASLMIVMTDITPVRESARFEEKLYKYRNEQTQKLTNTLIDAFEQGNLNVEITQSIHDNDTREIAQEFDAIYAILHKSIGNINGYIEELQSVLGEIARRDLTNKIARNYIGDFATMKNSVNLIFDGMNAFISELVSASGQVETGSELISETAQEMAASLQEQLDSMSVIYGQVNNITKEVTSNVDNVNGAAQLSVSAKEDARKGNQQMNEMLLAMEEIRNSSKTIAGIIRTIEG
ncbi:MAG: HAMP domain-containing protein, partial [Defluviitaleaceae bacterium]|nr:HAMP domain-containing protein [Defluviitaleaceae bacterium]